MKFLKYFENKEINWDFDEEENEPFDINKRNKK